MPVLHTPYDGSSKLFEIALKPLDLAEWIDADETLEAYLAEKDLLFAADLDAVFAAEPGPADAQAEVLALLTAHLPVRFPDLYWRSGATMAIGPSRRVALDTPEPPLLTAARLVQEDLLLMRKGETGWRLAAAALCFPSSWRLGEKLGRPMDEIHAPVPGFGAGTRPAELIARMFDHLRPSVPVMRWNWSIYGDDRLAHPEPVDSNAPRFGNTARAEHVFFRAERQTLRKLPASGDIVFAIRIYIDPIAALERHPDAPGIATRLMAQLRDLDDAQLTYKGLAIERERLLARLAEIA